MNEKDLKNVQVAAADLESMDFERDHAAMNLEDAVSTAVEHGEPIDDVAKAANLPPEEVTEHAETGTPADDGSGGQG